MTSEQGAAYDNGGSTSLAKGSSPLRHVATIEGIEHQASAALRSSPLPGFSRDGLLLDLSDAEFLQHDTMLYMGAVIRAHQDAGRVMPRIVLPESMRVLRFLRSWHFPEFLEAVSGTSVLDLLTPDSARRLFSPDIHINSYTHAIETKYNGYESLLPLTNFVIQELSISQNAWRAATAIQQRWLDVNILGVLDRLLDGEGYRIATHIITEAVLNCATHPQARRAFISAELSPPAREPIPSGRTLQIAVWDDGKTIAHTLGQQKRRGSILSPAFGAVNDTLELRDPIREQATTVIRGRNRRLPSFDEGLAACAFMMGVTSLPNRTGLSQERSNLDHDVDNILPREARDFGGLGLYLIRRTVLDLFGGTIRYFSGEYRLSLTSDRSGTFYTATVQRTEHAALATAGNLLIFDIPVGAP